MRALIKAINRSTRRLDRWTVDYPGRVALVCLVIFVLAAVALALYGAEFDRAMASPVMGISL